MKPRGILSAKISSLVFLILSFLTPDPLDAQIIGAVDRGLETGFQDTLFDNYRRGRAAIAADFNLDGFADYYIGNPGDESFILRNVPSPGGAPKGRAACASP